jgi:hypothetical protein
VYVLPANTTLQPVEQLPNVVNELHRATLEAKYFLGRHLAASLSYWFDKYDVDDFALGPDTVSQIALPGGTLLGYAWRPYTSHTVWVRLSYFW